MGCEILNIPNGEKKSGREKYSQPDKAFSNITKQVFIFA
jgi:hypothetical protein